MPIKLCRFVTPNIFDQFGNLTLGEKEISKFISDYGLLPKKGRDTFINKVVQDLMTNNYSTQNYSNLMRNYFNNNLFLSSTILGVYLDPDKVHTGIVDSTDKITRLNNSINNIIGGEEPIKSEDRFGLSEITFIPPVDIVDCYVLGNNYRHPDREKYPSSGYAKNPVFIAKSRYAIIGSRNPILIPNLERNNMIVPECELAVYVNGPISGPLPKDKVKQLIKERKIGLTIGNDITAVLGDRTPLDIGRVKSYPTFAPTGPYLELEFNLDRVPEREFSLMVSDRKVTGKASNFAFDIAQTISYFVESFGRIDGPTLICMGTTPENYNSLAIKSGDVIRCTVEGLGEQVNPVR